jgi:hypothetical protein
MDLSKVRHFINHNKILHDSFAVLLNQRNTGKPVTELRRLRFDVQKKLNTHYELKDFLDAWKRLEQFGVGYLLLPKKHPDPPRFKWKRGSALENAREICGVQPKPRPQPTIPPTNSIVFYYPIREHVVTIELPANATKDEILGLANHIQQLVSR